MHRRRLLLIKSREKQQGELRHRSYSCITCQELPVVLLPLQQHNALCVFDLFDDDTDGGGLLRRRYAEAVQTDSRPRPMVCGSASFNWLSCVLLCSMQALHDLCRLLVSA